MILRISDVSTRLKAGRDFVKMSEGERLLPPLTVSGDAIEAGAKLACLSSSGRLLAFPLSEIRFVASGGKGVALMLLDPGEEMISMAVTDDRGAILSGTGRAAKRSSPSALTGRTSCTVPAAGRCLKFPGRPSGLKRSLPYPQNPSKPPIRAAAHRRASSSKSLTKRPHCCKRRIAGSSA